MFMKYTLNRLLVLTASAGFAFLLADTIIEHLGTFNQEIMTYIPPIFSLIGVIIGLIAVYKWKSGIIRVMHMFLFLSFIVAAAGFYLHVAEEKDDDNLTMEQRLHEENEKDKPLLAPLAFGGVAVVGLLGTSRKLESERIED